MKKLIFLFTILSSLTYNAQTTVDDSQQNKEVLSFPTTPEAYSFDKVGKLPMDLYNGKANISIPIYEIKVGKLTFPIQLVYNTGGIKQNEIASSVGLGWTLSMPNKINKNIIGKNDEAFPINYKDMNVTNQFSVYNYGDTAKKQIFDILYEGTTYDTTPDIYYYNIPGANGSFILNNNVGYTIPNENLIIRNENSLISIKDTKNNKFWFSIKNSVNTRRAGNPEMANNLYSIDSIRTNENQLIKFEYSKNHVYKEENIFEKRIILTEQNIVNYKPFPIINTTPPPRVDLESNSEKLITKIIFPQGEIDFYYSGDNSLNTVGSEKYRKDINSDTGGIALRNIQVKNNHGEIIKDVTLDYSYFNSSLVNETYKTYRLKLNEIVDNLSQNKYSFEYNEEYNLPARGAHSDDYWGYFNSNLSGQTSIPNYISYFNDINLDLISGGRNRSTNPQYAQLGILKSITYPTGAKKNIYYESNAIESQQQFYVTKTDSYGGIDSDYNANPNLPPIVETTITIPQSEFVNKLDAKFLISFGNGCDNSGGSSQINSTFCRGKAIVGNDIYSFNGTPMVKEIPVTADPIKFSLTRAGECACDIGVSIQYKELQSTSNVMYVGGLRVKKIEDVDSNQTSNVFEYSYRNIDSHQGSGILKKRFNFVKPFFRIAKPENNSSADDYVNKSYEIQNSGNAFTSYNNSNIVTYSTVTESNGLGEIVYNYEDENPIINNGLSSRLGDSYNDWKYGLPKKIIYKKNGDTLKKETFNYEFNPLKNSLSGYTCNNNEEIAFGFDINLAQYFGNGASDYSYYVEYKPISINSAKIEKKQSKTTEYFKNNKVVETVTDYTYSDTDINKPINLMSTKTTFQDGSFDQTNYKYAHEKNNQLLIDKNMIGIPLETEVKKGSTTVSKTETVYPTSVPTAQTGSLVLPTSVVSYNLQNPATSSTEVTYDKYDAIGHIQQYTTKDGVSTTIIWGYNNTQPIAKIEGVKLSDISQSLIDTVVSASNVDAAAALNNDETALLSALNTFRSNVLTYQITTYTYDPLVGVRSITPPSGIREVYLYDSANRLKEVREQNQTGKLLKEYQYHYKN
jgi:hypothetical protein